MAGGELTAEHKLFMSFLLLCSPFTEMIYSKRKD